MSNSQALQSLTACYTDSEEEHEENVSRSPDEDFTKSNEASRDSFRDTTPPSDTPAIRTELKKSLRLVSYNDNNDDEEKMSEDEEIHPDDTKKLNLGEMSLSAKKTDEILDKLADQSDKFSKYRLKYGFNLPVEAKAKCNPELQEKIASLVDKMQYSNIDMNKIIQGRKEFRNPSIYEKLIQFCGINELGTNFSPDVYDVSIFSKESFYEELARVQKNEMDKIEKQKKENAKNDAIAKANKLIEDEPKKR